MQFRSAVDAGDGQIAALRLGDLALGTGDPATAIGWYRRAGRPGSSGGWRARASASWTARA